MNTNNLKQSIVTNPAMTQILQLANKNFKVGFINIFKHLEEKYIHSGGTDGYLVIRHRKKKGNSRVE